MSGTYSVDSEFSCSKSRYLQKKKRAFFCDRTELRDYWELCAHILGGNSLNYIVYEKIQISPKKNIFHDVKTYFSGKCHRPSWDRSVIVQIQKVRPQNQ